MREILGNDLEVAFKELSVPATMTYKGDDYEVWEMTDAIYDGLCFITDCNWKREYGWWRGASGCNIKEDEDNFTVNGKNMIGFVESFREDEYDDNMEEDEEDRIWREKVYVNLTDYICEGLGASQPKNVVAVAIDLAKMNDMKMSELFKKYQGGK